MDTGDSIQGHSIHFTGNGFSDPINHSQVVLPNNSIWRPGTFIKAQIRTVSEKDGLIVDKNAVQLLDGREVVLSVMSQVFLNR